MSIEGAVSSNFLVPLGRPADPLTQDDSRLNRVPRPPFVSQDYALLEGRLKREKRGLDLMWVQATAASKRDSERRSSPPVGDSSGMGVVTQRGMPSAASPLLAHLRTGQSCEQSQPFLITAKPQRDERPRSARPVPCDFALQWGVGIPAAT